jgi:hypothetical protein
MTQKKQPEDIEEEFSKRIKTYDALNFLKDGKILSSIMQSVVKMDQRTIAEITSKQLQALPIRR